MDFLSIARSALAQQPFSVHMGAEITHCSPQHTEIHMPMKDEYTQQYGTAHGGALSFLADTALAFAGAAALQSIVVTSEFKIHYLKPAVGHRLTARARAISHGQRQAVCQCDIYALKDGEEKMVATAIGTILPR
ncbi:PaaI family thioesterase [Deinococcus cellulosilyticus]|uniref:Medium/long-chain acyl-CoA thioesterase YigI n=1 Tax=Deinococcus cellulosilyticus (strain DSM 18568 / NBRC 106333 / KACC 11606 / 5516J-15) TaxID=1223518 RepID=A0A511N1N6_DEIC1|nr:PaaI family thioesterase [Deinococcus cellulosilyticus]GEM46729.1 phenylacetic acid degradation protein [Deinococcus cellulosilyticus NBRC 106333 = KACC 11606]